MPPPPAQVSSLTYLPVMTLDEDEVGNELLKLAYPRPQIPGISNSGIGS